MDWVGFSLLGVSFLSISNVLQRVLMKGKNSDPYAYSITFQLLAALIIFCFSLISGFRLPPIFDQPVNYLLLGALYGIGTVFIFKALQHLEAAEVTILTSLRAFITIIASVTLLKEAFTITHLLGALLIFAAVVIVTHKKEKFTFNKGFWYSLGMAVCYGLATANDRYLLTSSVDTLSFSAISFLLPGMFIVALKPSALRQITLLFNKRIFLPMFFMSLLYALATICYFTAFAKGALASQTAPLQQSSVVLTVLLAAIFLGERKNLTKKCIGAALVFAGILLLK